MREKKLEALLTRTIRSKGGFCEKFTGYNGAPDRICILNKVVFFVEVKTTGEVPRVSQWRAIYRLREQGVSVYVIDTVKRMHDALLTYDMPKVHRTLDDWKLREFSLPLVAIT